MLSSSATARLETRISVDLHSMLKHAAELQGRTISDFVASAVREAAESVIEHANVIRLALVDQQCFAKALLSPSKPAPALKRAFKNKQKLLRDAA